MCPPTNVITSAEETPNTFVKTVPGRDLSEQGLNLIEPPRRPWEGTGSESSSTGPYLLAEGIPEDPGCE